jgi:hypothetical protein
MLDATTNRSLHFCEKDVESTLIYIFECTFNIFQYLLIMNDVRKGGSVTLLSQYGILDEESEPLKER